MYCIIALSVIGYGFFLKIQLNRENKKYLEEFKKKIKECRELEKEYSRKEEKKKKEGENDGGYQKVDVFGMEDGEETFIDNGWLGGDECPEDDNGDDDKGETK